MKCQPVLQSGTLIKRYKRFLADIMTPHGPLTIHCPNTGSMRHCAEPGSPVLYSDSGNPKRKYRHTWEAVQINTHWIGINTQRANPLIAEALQQQTIREVADYPQQQREVSLSDGSRLDFCLSQDTLPPGLQHPGTDGNTSTPSTRLSPQGGRVYMEVKNLTLREEDGYGYFPDAVTTRGLKHLHSLMACRQAGHRAVLMFCVQHTGIQQVRPAQHIDPAYSDGLRQAAAAGVEVLAYGASLSAEAITINRALAVELHY